MADDAVVKLACLQEGEWFGADDAFCWMSGAEQSSALNRRGQSREHAHIEVQVDPGGGRGTVNDISIGGVLIYTDNPLTVGTSLNLTLLTDRGMVRAVGVVRWVAKGAMHDIYHNRLGMGVQFLWVEIGLRAVLEHTLCYPAAHFR
jgi:hypothetical protein